MPANCESFPLNFFSWIYTNVTSQKWGLYSIYCLVMLSVYVLPCRGNFFIMLNSFVIHCVGVQNFFIYTALYS